MKEKPYPDALFAGHHVRGCVLEQALGQGAFGITCLACDVHLHQRVAIKACLPSEFLRRRSAADAHARTAGARPRRKACAAGAGGGH